MNEREDGGRRSIKRRVGLAVLAVFVALLAFAFIRGWFVERPLYADLFHTDPASIEVVSYGHTQEYRKGDAEYGHVLGILRGTRYDSVIRRRLAIMGITSWGGVQYDGDKDSSVSRASSSGVVIKVTYSSPQECKGGDLVYDYDTGPYSVIYLLPLDRDFIGESEGRQYLTVLFEINKEGFGYIRITPELKAYCDSLKASSKAQ